jgi:hypothetical protein
MKKDSRGWKRWMDCVKNDMIIKRVMEMMGDRREWKKKTML